jgi:hypothetical protein
MSNEDLRKKARRRALRAAQVVTLGLAMAGPGCGDSHQLGADASGTDGGPIAVDADTPPPRDFGTRADLGRDLGPRDLGHDLGEDMGSCPTDPFGTPPETRECCDEIGGWWDDSTDTCLVAVPGPFVPPPMNA